jgi:hypothetical protein
MNTFSNWRSVRMWESRLTRDLRQRRVLWLHGLCIGLITLAVTWGASALQMHLGGESLALRYLVSLGVGYLSYLLTVRLWAEALIRPGHAEVPDVDVSGLDLSGPHGAWEMPNLSTLRSGGGGDFGGGGASGDFSDGAAGAADGLGELAGGAIEAAAGSDEAAIVVVPVVAVFLIGCAVFFGAGALVLLYFGWDVLLAVAVELAFSYATARTAVRVTREGWTSAAVRLTWKPLAGAVLCAVMLGATIDYFIPTAQSLPQALKALRHSG